MERLTDMRENLLSIPVLEQNVVICLLLGFSEKSGDQEVRLE
jgi:hypothetical protein